MEEGKKCSLEAHKEIYAIKYCPECKIYMCHKCENQHSSPIFNSHHPYDITKENEIFTGFCKEKNHSNKLEYFCKNHNKLCCSNCLCNVKETDLGQHKDCDVCRIEKIKEEKKNKLKENINNLEKLLFKLNESIEYNKKQFEKNEKDREDLKSEILNTFTKIRNALNNKEDELLKEIDIIFNNNYYNEELIKKRSKLSSIINSSIEKGKSIDKEWNDNILNSYINDCINIENNIKNIKIVMKEDSNKYNIKDQVKIIFLPKVNQLKKYFKSIESLSKIYYYNRNYSYKIYQIRITENSNIININKYLLCDYPFQNDKKNHSISTEWDPYFYFGKEKALLTEYNGLKCIDTNGILAVKRNIDLNRDWILIFEFCKKDWSSFDWAHIFSFGTHIKYGSDNSYYAITMETKARDGYLIMKLTQKNAGDGKWHRIIVRYAKEIKLLEGFVDNMLIESKEVLLTNTSGFYFGGKGWMDEFSMYLRNFKFFLDLNLNYEEIVSIID